MRSSLWISLLRTGQTSIQDWLNPELVDGPDLSPEPVDGPDPSMRQSNKIGLLRVGKHKDEERIGPEVLEGPDPCASLIRKIAAVFFFLGLISLTPAFAGIPHFESAPSDSGPTGNIRTPNTYSLRPGMVSLGVHSIRVKINLGLPFENIEAGIAADLGSKTTFQELQEKGQLSFKYAPLQHLEYPVKAAIGVEQSGGRPVVFGLVSYVWKKLGIRGLALEASLGTGTTRLNPLFISIVLRFRRQSALIAELEGDKFHAGFRILLSSSLRLDAFYLDLRTPLGDRPVRSVFSDRLRIGISKTLQMFGGTPD